MEVGGYTIPKGTFILGNIHSLHNDPEVWGDPQNFRPDRWIDELGRLKKNKNLLPFAIGKKITNWLAELQ